MLQRLDWRTLEQRRVDSRLCMLYKIRNHLIAIEEEHYVQRGTGRCSHQYRQLRADRHYTRFSTIIQWNQLSSQTFMAVTRHLQDPGREDRASKTQLLFSSHEQRCFIYHYGMVIETCSNFYAAPSPPRM